MDAPTLPNDLHVHTEWSYDAYAGSMEGSCRRALELGVPVLAFTEHADFGDGVPRLDVEGYLASVQRCREMFPSLRILSGVELGEGHRFPDEASALLRSSDVDLVLGSVHRIEIEGRLEDVDDHLAPDVAEDSALSYFQEVLDLLEAGTDMAVLAHVDYPKRYWPHAGLPYVETDFEEEYRSILKAAATSGLALEINTGRDTYLDPGPCPGPVVVRWWYEAGGEAVTFASDAHSPDAICSGFSTARDIAESAGFRSASRDFGFWLR